MKIFHMDNRAGRVLWVVWSYFLFWAVFYGLLIIAPKSWILYGVDRAGMIFPIYLYGVVPILSLFLLRRIRRQVKMKRWVAWLLHLCVLFVMLIAFFSLYMIHTYSSIGPEDFQYLQQ